jgi:hypothetical protein
MYHSLVHVEGVVIRVFVMQLEEVMVRVLVGGVMRGVRH